MGSPQYELIDLEPDDDDCHTPRRPAQAIPGLLGQPGPEPVPSEFPERLLNWVEQQDVAALLAEEAAIIRERAAIEGDGGWSDTDTIMLTPPPIDVTPPDYLGLGRTEEAIQRRRDNARRRRQAHRQRARGEYRVTDKRPILRVQTPTPSGRSSDEEMPTLQAHDASAGKGLCTLSLETSSSPRVFSPTFEADYRMAVDNIPLPAEIDVADGVLPPFYDLFLRDSSENSPEYWDPQLLDEVLVLVSPSVFPEGPPADAEVASTSGNNTDITWVTALPFYDVDVDIEVLASGEEQHIRLSPAANEHHNLSSPIPWLSGALVRTVRTTRIWPAGTAAAQSWDWRFVLNTGLQFLTAVVAQVQEEYSNQGRYFAGLRGVATDDGCHTLHTPQEVFRVTVSLVRLDNEVVGVVERYPRRIDIITFGGNSDIGLLTARVRRAMEDTYGLSLTRANFQVFAAPGRPNRLDRVLAVLFTLRESTDPAAPRLSVTDNTALLRQNMADVLLIAYGAAIRWPAAADLDSGGNPLQRVPPPPTTTRQPTADKDDSSEHYQPVPAPPTMIRRPGTDMPGGADDVPCVASTGPRVAFPVGTAGHQATVSSKQRVPETLYRPARRIIDNFSWSTATAKALQDFRSERRNLKDHLLHRYNTFRAVVQRHPYSEAIAREALWSSVRRSTEVFQDRLLAVVRDHHVRQYTSTDVIPPGLLLDFTAELGVRRYAAPEVRDPIRWCYTTPVPL